MRASQGRREVYRLWQAGGGYDRNLTDPNAVGRAIEYIEWNPVRKNIVTHPSGWRWSSAQAREGVKDVPIQIDEVKLVSVTNERDLRKL